jgi:hypothetical protein
MNALKTFLCAFSALISVHTIHAGGNVTLATIDYVTDRVRFRFEISAELARKTPKWDGTGVLPLQPDRAVEIAKRSLGSEVTGMQLREVCLRGPVKDEEGVVPIFYLLTFVPRDVPMKRPYLSAVVLFDGTVVQPKSEKIEVGPPP